jgi:hypothetical protein
LGGQYAVGIAQPFDFTSIGSGYGLPTGAGNVGLYNTVLIPGQIAWKFGDLHVKGSLEVHLDDASTTLGQIHSGKTVGGGLPSGNGYTTLDPVLGVSWLNDGWNLSASAHLLLPLTSDTGTSYTYKSGNEVAIDYTATKQIDKWTVGLGAASQNQLNNDTKNGASVANSKATNYSIGPIVGYQFGGISVTGIWSHAVYTENDPGGDMFNLRLTTRF